MYESFSPKELSDMYIGERECERWIVKEYHVKFLFPDSSFECLITHLLLLLSFKPQEKSSKKSINVVSPSFMFILPIQIAKFYLQFV
jgi:hypothetical protein